MRALDGSGQATGLTGGRSGGVRCGPLAAAVLGIIALCCLFGPLAAAGASPASGAHAAKAALELAELSSPSAYRFGYSVAIDSDMALVGAPNTGDYIGAVYSFQRVDGAWVQQQVLSPADGVSNTFFGYSVALDGNTALIGAMGNPDPGQETLGAAYLFVFYGGMWTQRQKMTAPDGVAGDKFGASVALSGYTALIGAPYHDVDGKVWQGAAYVFVANRPVWMYQAELTGADGVAGDQFGASVSLSGETAVIGARGHRPGADPPNAGAAYVFVRALGPTGAPAWSQQTELTAADGEAGDLFGTSVAVDGDTALVGAPHASVGSGGNGSAYVFARFAGSWSQQAKLTATGAPLASRTQNDFGWSVALSGDAALVGAPGHDRSAMQDCGVAYTFARSGVLWVQQQVLTAADGKRRDSLGTSVALSGDTSLVGAPKHPLDGEVRGAAYIFPATPSIKTFKPAYGPVGTSVSITGSFFGDVTGVAFNGTAAVGYIVFGVQISATVPAGAQTGPITLTFPSGSYVSDDVFVVTTGLTPAIGKLMPASAKPGRLVTISGANFGSKWRHGSSVKFGSKKAIVSSWSATEIKCKVPLRTGWGAMLVTVTTLRGTSNGVSFTVNH